MIVGNLDFDNIKELLKTFNIMYSFFIGILGGWFLRILYIFITKTSVGILATKIEVPNDKDIKSGLGIFNKEINRFSFIENLDHKSHLSYIDGIKDFYYRNSSKVYDLMKNSNISLFLLAHQSIITKLGYDLQDQKTVKLFHKIRGTYGNSWSWEKKYNFRFIKYFVFWRNYIKGWDYKVIKSDGFDWNKDIVFKIQVSFPIHSTLEGIGNVSYYELNLQKGDNIGNKNFLRRYFQLKQFEIKFKNELNEIEKNIGRGKKIHLLMNIPAPFAFLIGKNIHSSGPEILIYEEYEGKYHSTFTLKK